MSEYQTGLFDERSAADSRRPAQTLILSAQSGQVLTKAQRTFNRLVAKVEKLRARLEQEGRRLDAALAYFAREIHPRLQRQAELRRDLVRALAPFLDDPRLKSKKDRALLRGILRNQLDLLGGTDEGLAAADLRALFERLHGESLADAEAREFTVAKEMMEEMFGDLGVDIDFSTLKPGMSEAEIAAALAGQFGQPRSPAAEPGGSGAEPSRPDKRQLAREARERAAEELRQKTLSSIYKQLAKALHPDLEPDLGRRQRKVALMQELTTAYRASDLSTLLRLELEWLHREEADAARLTGEKLTIFNAVLREQAQELEQELFDLPGHPRYHRLLKTTGPYSVDLWTDDPAEAVRLDQMLSSMERSLANLRGPNPVAELREAIAHFRSSGLA
jgi:hypothetical protein